MKGIPLSGEKFLLCLGELNDIVYRAVDLLYSGQLKNLHIGISPDNVYVYADEEKLIRFLCMFRNAIEALKDGGIFILSRVDKWVRVKIIGERH